MAPYDDYISEAALRHGLDPNILRAFMQVESSGDPNAVSPVGATGLMQLMPIAIKDLGYDPATVDLTDPATNIDLGAQYINRLKELGIPNDPIELAAAYNMGPTAYKEKGGDAYEETRSHKEKIAESLGFDPEGEGYDFDSAIAAGLEPDETGHWPSRVPETGLLLKGTSHPTFDKTISGEADAGYEIYKSDDGRYYSKKIPQPTSTIFREGKDELTEVREAIGDYFTDFVGKEYLPWQVKAGLAGLAEMGEGFAFLANTFSPETAGNLAVRGALKPLVSLFEEKGLDVPESIQIGLRPRKPLDEALEKIGMAKDYWTDRANEHEFGKEASPLFKWLGDFTGTHISNTGAMRFWSSLGDVVVPAGAFARHLGLNDNIAQAGSKLLQHIVDPIGKDIAKATKQVSKPLGRKLMQLGDEKAIADEILSGFSDLQAKTVREELDGELAKILSGSTAETTVDDVLNFVDSYEMSQIGHIIRNHYDFAIGVRRAVQRGDISQAIGRQLVKNAHSRMKAIREPVAEATRGLKARHIINSTDMPLTPEEALKYLDDFSEHGMKPLEMKTPSGKEVLPGRTEHTFTGKRLPFLRRIASLLDASNANAEHGANMVERLIGKGESWHPFTTWSWTNRSKSAMRQNPVQGREVGFWIADNTPAPGDPSRTMGDYGNLRTIHRSIKTWLEEDGLTQEALGMSPEEYYRFIGHIDSFILARHRVTDGLYKLRMHDKNLFLKNRLKRIRASLEAHRNLIETTVKEPGIPRELWDDFDAAVRQAIPSGTADPQSLGFAVKNVDDAIKQIDELIKRNKFHITNEEMMKHQRAVLSFQRLYMENPKALVAGEKFAENVVSSYHALLKILEDGGRITAKEAAEIQATHPYYTYVKRISEEMADEEAVGRSVGTAVDEVLEPWRLGMKSAEESPIQNLITRSTAIQGWYTDQLYYKAFRKAWIEAGDDAIRKDLWPGFEIQFTKKKPKGGKAYVTIWDNGKKSYMTGNDAAMEEILQKGFGESDAFLRTLADLPGIRQSTALFRNAVTMSIRFAFKNLIRDSQSAHILAQYPYAPVLMQLKSAAHLLPHSLATHVKDGYIRQFLETMGNSKYWHEFAEQGYSMSAITDIGEHIDFDPVLRQLEDPSFTVKKAGQHLYNIARTPAKFSEQVTRGGSAIKIFGVRDKWNKRFGLEPGVWYPRQYIEHLRKQMDTGIGIRTANWLRKPGMYGVPEAFERALRKKTYPITLESGREAKFGERFNYFYEGAGSYPTKADALYDIRDASVDFNRFAKKARSVNALYPFFNANQRELVRIFKQMRDQPLTTMYRATRMSGTMSMYENTKFYDDPDYQQLPAYRKLAFWTVYKDPETGRFWQIPVGFMSGMLTKFVFDRFYQWMYEGAKQDPQLAEVLKGYQDSSLDTMGELDVGSDNFDVDKATAADVLRGSFSVIGEQQPYPGIGSLASISSGKIDASGSWRDLILGFIPQLAKGVFEVGLGWDDFRDKEINYEASLPDSGANRLSWFDEFTSPTMIGLANGMDKLTLGFAGKILGPRDYEHIVESYFGNIGMDAIHGIDRMMGERWGGEYPRSAKYLKPREEGVLPAVASFLKGTVSKTLTAEPPHGTRSAAYDTYYETAKEIADGANSIKADIRADRYTEAAEKLKANPGFIGTEQAKALMDEYLSGMPEDLRREARKAFDKDKIDPRNPRIYTTPRTIIEDTDTIKEWFNTRIAENARKFAIWDDENKDASVEQRERVWREVMKEEDGLRRAQTSAFRNAIQKIGSGNWSETAITTLLDNVSVDELAQILRAEKVKKQFDIPGLYDKRVRRKILDALDEAGYFKTQ